MRKTKRVNWLKVVLLILTVIEFTILVMVDKELVKSNMTLWRLCMAMTCCMFINVLYIGAKKEVK